MSVNANKVRRLVQEALDALAPSLHQVAKPLRVSYPMTRQYARGRYTAPAAVLRRLAKLLRSRARGLVRMADRVEREADRND